MSRNARLTPEERYQRRLQGLTRGGSAKKPPTQPQPKVDPAPHSAEARAFADIRAEAKANAAVIAHAQAAAEATTKPWVPGADIQARYVEPTAWFD